MGSIRRAEVSLSDRFHLNSTPEKDGIVFDWFLICRTTRRHSDAFREMMNRNIG
jgi:hypothetical protein